MAPVIQTSGDDSPPGGFPSPEPDSDRPVGSLAELNERLSEIDGQIIQVKTAQAAESTARRAAEQDLANRDSTLANGLMVLGQAVTNLTTEVRGAVATILRRLDASDKREADRDARLVVEFSRLHRQDSIHDDAVTETRLAVKKQETALQQVKSLFTVKNTVGGVLLGVAANAHHIAEALKTLFGGH